MKTSKQESNESCKGRGNGRVTTLEVSVARFAGSSIKKWNRDPGALPLAIIFHAFSVKNETRDAGRTKCTKPRGGALAYARATAPASDVLTRYVLTSSY